VSRRAKILLLLMLCGVGLGFFYLRVLARRVFFEVPAQPEEAVRTQLSEAALQSAGPSQQATLYFPSLAEGKLVPESRAVTWAESDADRVRQVVLALIEGSRQGLAHPLPASTSVRAVFLTADGTAYVDLSKDVLNGFTPGIENETLTVYSVVNSITKNIPSVKKVRLLIEGQEVETLDGHADLTEALVPDSKYLPTAP
jgi:spore germination protein GerM